MEERAYAEELTWACAKEIANQLESDEINHPDLSEITDTLASTYYANLSVLNLFLIPGQLIKFFQLFQFIDT